MGDSDYMPFMFRQDQSETPSHYRTAQVCLNGHGITDDIEMSPELMSKYCARCGTETITKCPECDTSIRGYYYVSGVLSARGYAPPRHCHNCGKPMPWTKKAIDLAQEFASEIDDLTSTEQATLKTAIADLSIEGPQSDVAQARYKKLLGKVAPTVKATLDKIVVTIVTEAAKKFLGL